MAAPPGTVAYKSPIPIVVPAAVAAKGGVPAGYLTPEDVKSWAQFYPCYFNSKRSIGQGRRLPKAACCEDPTFDDLAHAAKELGFRCGLEAHHKHPQDFDFSGRIRVDLSSVDGGLTKHALLKTIAATIATLPTRAARLEARAKAAAAAAAGTGTGAGGGKKSKKSKKKKSKR